MNKTAIRNFAVWARNKLIADITYKAGLLGVTDKGIKSPLLQSTQMVQFFEIGTKEPYSITGVEIEQRKKLVAEIQSRANHSDYKTAYKNIVEEVAYTWFNRLIAIRFMEVNDYLPTHIRVLSSESRSKTEPDLVTHPLDADLNYTPYEKDRIIQLKHDNKLDELFRMLFTKQCNFLNVILPNLFEKTSDYTELLLNVFFSDKDGVVFRLVHDINEEDFNVSKEGQVEIIGWLYQYYNSEPKDEVFALLKKSVKITQERIPAATQIFTPDWIVRYMVENSLGRLWIEGHPDDAKKSGWKYYLDEVEQEKEVKEQLAVIREEYRNINPEDIKIIDPAMGSGHILVYAFDVLMQIYEGCGYSQRDAATSIIENNLYGLDIDNRAYQLAYFAVMMKARQYNRRILNGETTCHIFAIQDSNNINRIHLKYFGDGMHENERKSALHQMNYILDIYNDAKEYGSILNVQTVDWQLLYHFLMKINLNGQMALDTFGIEDTQKQLFELVEVATFMTQKYDVVITNPPYMGNKGMTANLSNYISKNYYNSKIDLYAVFIEICSKYTTNNGLFSLITPESWMFLSRFAKFRIPFLTKNTFVSFLHFGFGAFESGFGTAAFVIRKCDLPKYYAKFFRLNEYNSAQEKEKAIFTDTPFLSNKLNYEIVEGAPISYWVSPKMLANFTKPKIKDIGKTCVGLLTGDNEQFFRNWYEVSFDKVGISYDANRARKDLEKKWFPINQYGEYRKWYGNNIIVFNWWNNGYDIKKFKMDRFLAGAAEKKNSMCWNEDTYFCSGITWNRISTSKFSARYSPDGNTAGSSSPIYFVRERPWFFLALFNSVVFSEIVSFINPTVSFQTADIEKVPVVFSDFEVDDLAKQNVLISRQDWDSFEISWDFSRHPLLVYRDTGLIKDAFFMWEQFTQKQYEQLKVNEERINSKFIDIYGLNDELPSAVEDRDITISKAEIGRDIRSFISYAVGCMFGRYSLDVDGLVYAGGIWDDHHYETFIPASDNIIPITDEEYFEDDIVGLFCEFVKKTFGAESLEKNLDFIAEALENKGNTSREMIRYYFLKGFFKDHCKMFQKRPIYWLFDSGNENGFKALIYIHRYNDNTIGNLRIDYLHRIQHVYESEKARMQEIIENSANAREVASAEKRKEKLTKQVKETKNYDELIAHLALARKNIDLDDGIRVNYDSVQCDIDGKNLEVLARIL